MIFVSSKKKLRIFLAVILIIALLGTLAWYFLSFAYPFVLTLAEYEVKLETINAINIAADRIRRMQAFSGAYYTYEKNNEGDVVLVTANTANINTMFIIAQTEIQRELNKLSQSQIGIPLGAFTGSALLSDKGSDINVNVSPIGTAEASWNSYFINEGINQTLHRVVLSVRTDVEIIIPLKADRVTIVTDIVLAEDVIIGRVPEMYINGLNSEDHILDLLP